MTKHFFITFLTNLLGFQNPNVAVEAIKPHLGSAIAHARPRKSITSVDKLAIASFSRARRLRQRCNRKVGINATVERLVPQVGRQVLLKRDLDDAVYGMKSRI